MARIMIFDLPAVSGGALTILDMYHKIALADKENEYIFVVSLPTLEQTDNVTVLNFPKVKRSWFHRYYFDKFRAKKLVNQYKPDKILQNCKQLTTTRHAQFLLLPPADCSSSTHLHKEIAEREFNAVQYEFQVTNT